MGVNLRYHGDQGFSRFLNNSNFGHVNTEIALAYDISDYLNDSRKTLYLKSGLY